MKEGAEKFASKNLNFVITSWLKISYKGLMRLKKVFACYMDLTTDSILLYSIWYTVGDGKFEEYMKYCHPWIGILSKEKKVEKCVTKNENRSLSFYEEAVEEVLISVRGDQSATRSDVTGQEVLQQTSVPISGAATTPTENQLQNEDEA